MAEKRPPNPYLVLASAIVLPASGQVWNGFPFRGLVFLFFMVLLGTLTLLTARPEVSVIGKLAGGIFVYAISIFDAYKIARIRAAVWGHRQSQKT